MPEKKKRKDNADVLFPMKRIGICALIGAAVFFLELVLFSAAELKMAFGNGFYLPVGLTASLVSSFAAGFMAVFKSKKNALACGALTGALEAVISDVLLVVLNGGSIGKGLIFVALAGVAGGAVGGVVAANVRPKIKY